MTRPLFFIAKMGSNEEMYINVEDISRLEARVGHNAVIYFRSGGDLAINAEDAKALIALLRSFVQDKEE